MNQTTTTKTSKYIPAAPGAILHDALYTIQEAAARLGWGGHAFRAARNNGLRVHRCGKRGYVTGADLMAFITKRQQDEPTLQDVQALLKKVERMLACMEPREQADG
jgi:hypothetical protein